MHIDRYRPHRQEANAMKLSLGDLRLEAEQRRADACHEAVAYCAAYLASSVAWMVGAFHRSGPNHP